MFAFLFTKCLLKDKMRDMQKFTDWLNANPGIATKLKKELGINATTISNVKAGRRKLPVRWIPVIHRMSRRKISFAEMVRSRDITLAAPPK